MSYEGFLTSPWTAMVFFRYCMRYKITDMKERTAVMRRLVKKKQAKYIPHPEEFVKGKRVLKFRTNGDINE